MLEEILTKLLNAKTDTEKNRIYKQLEKVGMDKTTVDYLAQKMVKK